MTNLKRYFGCHVSASGGLENGLKNGDALGVNTIQVHPCPPQRWNFKPFEPQVAEKFLEAKKTAKVEKIFFHAIYLINLANPEPKQNQLSKTSLIHDLNLSGQIGGEGVIFHVGSMKHIEDDKEAFTFVAQSVDDIIEKSHPDSTLLMEVSAGAGKIIGAKFEQLSQIYDRIKESNKPRVGFALDTQHMWASGYNLQENLEEIIKNLGDAFGFDKIKAVHLNDSKSACDSKIDRHENLGDGQIGEVALKNFLNHPQLRDIPFILETPAMKDVESALVEARKLAAWVN